MNVERAIKWVNLELARGAISHNEAVRCRSMLAAHHEGRGDISSQKIKRTLTQLNGGVEPIFFNYDRGN